MTSNQRDVLLRAGSKVGDYRIVEPVGLGGMGTVYRATHPVLGNQVAIKVLHAKHAWDPSAVARFEREARLVSQLQHPNIVVVFNFGSLPNGRRYYVMEYLEGTSLKQHLEQHQRLTVRETLAILAPVASALDAAHLQGVIHRDIKPANIFLEAGGRGVKLLDFGIAKLINWGGSDITSTDQLPGTPRYMSPEQCQGVAVDPRSDIYSLALVAFECLSGDAPFSKRPVGEVLMLHQTAPPPRLHERCPDLPSELDRPLLKALKKDPSARQNSASELVQQLATTAGLQLRELEAAPLHISDRQPRPAPTKPADRDERGTLGLSQVMRRSARLRRLALVLAPVAVLAILATAGLALFGDNAHRPDATVQDATAPGATVPDAMLPDAAVADSQATVNEQPSRKHRARKIRTRKPRPRRKTQLKRPSRRLRRSKAKDRPDEGPLIRF